MNINSTIKKLQSAILRTGLVITINRSQFYSEEQERFITMISLSTKETYFSERQRAWKERSLEIIKTPSQVEVLNCLVDIYKAVKAWS